MQSSWPSPDVAGEYFDLDLGDVNHDGWLDILAARDGLGVMVWLGDGAGGWTASNTNLPTTGAFFKSVFSLVDHDGNLDIVSSGLNQGVKVWTAAEAAPPTINNLPATVNSVDGINVTGTAYTTPGTQNPGFTFTERSRTVRVDLSIAPLTDTYDTWAAGFFPGHPTAQSGQAVDADGDGQNNYSEYLAGTIPTQSNSALRILTIHNKP